MDDMLRRERKYKAFWAMFLVITGLLTWNKLNGDQYVELMIFTFGLYMAGNVGEHVSNAIAEKKQGAE